jgi:hypothetical protein
MRQSVPLALSTQTANEPITPCPFNYFRFLEQILLYVDSTAPDEADFQRYSYVLDFAQLFSAAMIDDDKSA